MKVIFMGTPEFAIPTLELLHKEGYEIPLVITQPDRPKGRGKKLTPPPVKIKGEELRLNIYQPKKVNSEDSVSKIKEITPDFIVVVAYGQILKREILDAPKYGCINVHASLLPYYRGAAPINWTIINGEEKTGITTMHMNEGLDTGDMLLQKSVEIGEDETAEDLHDKLKIMGAELLIKTLRGLEKGEIKGIPQDDNKATYAPMLDKNTGKIDFSKSAKEIKNLVRGTTPRPGAYIVYKGKKVKVFSVEIDNKSVNEPLGKVLNVDDNGIYISTRDGCLVIKELQFPGKKRMTVKEYLVGNKFEKGIILE